MNGIIKGAKCINCGQEQDISVKLENGETVLHSPCFMCGGYDFQCRLIVNQQSFVGTYGTNG